MQKSIFVSLVTIGLLASVIGVGTYAYFSETETSSGNTMTAGSLDLKVWNPDTSMWVDDPNVPALVTISDMKPSYEKWSDAIYLKVVDNPAKLWKRITNVQCVGGVFPEPEQAVETAANEQHTNTLADMGQGTNWLPGVTEFAMKINDGTATSPVILNGILGQWQYLGVVEQGQQIKVEQYFHMVNTAGNEYQGDQCTFSEQFLAHQTNDQSDPNA